MPDKAVAGHFIGCGIIFRASNPRHLFFDIKDDQYPQIPFRNHFCFIGGNFIGDKARGDYGPQNTFLREMSSELSFARPKVDSEELLALQCADPKDVQAPYTTAPPAVKPTEEDEAALYHLKAAIIAVTMPWTTVILRVPREVHVAANPTTTMKDSSAICCYYAVGLNEKAWEDLFRLQNKFGNLSNESNSALLTVDEMIAKGLQGLAGHDQVLQRFLREKGISEAERLPIHPGPTVEFLDHAPYETYAELTSTYPVERRP